jgi:hypothetical protein
VAGGSGLNARTSNRPRVQGTYKGKKNISRTHVRLFVRVFGVVGEVKKNTPEAQTTRLDASFGLFLVHRDGGGGGGGVDAVAAADGGGMRVPSLVQK